jgi:hypothetical protein
VAFEGQLLVALWGDAKVRFQQALHDASSFAHSQLAQAEGLFSVNFLS